MDVAIFILHVDHEFYTELALRVGSLPSMREPLSFKTGAHRAEKIYV